MTTGELIVIASVVFAAATVTMVAGFGFALLAMPLLTLAVPVSQAVVIVVLLGLCSTTWQAVALRRDALRPLVRQLTVSACVGMPLGLVILDVVDDRPLRVGLGAAVLVATVFLACQPRLAHVGPGLEYSLGFVSGVLNTSLGTNGPPLVFVLQARRLRPDQFRATIAVVFMLSNILAAALFVVDGKLTGAGLAASAAALPAWFAGSSLGAAIRPRVSATHFRWMVLLLLLTTGSTAIIAAFV
jgi:uncharacterized membrane protein YfcA